MHSCLRVVYVLSEHVERVVDSSLEVGRMEALCKRLPPADIHLIANVLVNTFQLHGRGTTKKGREKK